MEAWLAFSGSTQKQTQVSPCSWIHKQGEKSQVTLPLKSLFVTGLWPEASYEKYLDPHGRPLDQPQKASWEHP